MTVKQLKEILSKYDDDKNVYIWAGNWPKEHYKTNFRIGTDLYGSILDDKMYVIEDPLVII